MPWRSGSAITTRAPTCASSRAARRRARSTTRSSRRGSRRLAQAGWPGWPRISTPPWSSAAGARATTTARRPKRCRSPKRSPCSCARSSPAGTCRSPRATWPTSGAPGSIPRARGTPRNSCARSTTRTSSPISPAASSRSWTCPTRTPKTRTTPRTSRAPSRPTTTTRASPAMRSAATRWIRIATERRMRTLTPMPTRRRPPTRTPMPP